MFWGNKIAITVFALLLAQTSFAAKLKASCSVLENGEIQGTNIDKKVEIASVSKVMTSLWAASTLGLNYRYQTIIHLTPVEDNLYDVHIQGSKDPYFSRHQLQFLVSELNHMQITSIRKLSFDENFYFESEVRSGGIVVNEPSVPGPTDVAASLKRETRAANLANMYAELRAKAQNLAQLNLVQKLNLKVAAVEFQLSAGFQKMPETKSWTLRSAPLYKILHDIDRASNNYGAHLVFEGLGGKEAFNQFLSAKLGLTTDSIDLQNGSGYPVTPTPTTRIDNMATCASIITVVKALEAVAVEQGFVLQDILSVAGMDISGDEDSTVTGAYSNEMTMEALVAKTGTANPSVALAGLASTQKGKVYFATIVGTSGRNRDEIKIDQRAGRTQILNRVTTMIREHDGPRAVAFKPYYFLPFDQESRLTEANEISLAIH